MAGKKSFIILSGLILSPTLVIAQDRSPWPQIREFGGATPKNQRAWIMVDDYPIDALRRGEQGNVVVAFDITPEGRARNCRVEISSGSLQLDHVPCPAIERRARFKPALDEAGSPIDTHGRYSVAFWMPE